MSEVDGGCVEHSFYLSETIFETTTITCNRERTRGHRLQECQGVCLFHNGRKYRDIT